MAKNSKSLQKKIKRITNKSEGIADELEKEIVEYQKQYEKELLKMKFDDRNGRFKPTQKNYNAIQSMKMTKRLKWSAIVAEHIKKYNHLPLFSKEFHKEIGIDVENINYRDLKIVDRFKSQDANSLLTEGETLDNLVKKELINSVAVGADINDSIDNLSKQLLGSGDEKLGRLARYATTYIRTSTLGLSRLIDKEVYDTLNLKDEYLYVGTVDGKIRDFCRHRVGKTFTLDQIEKFPNLNGSGLDPWLVPGGWNCRHRLVSTDLI